MDNQIPIVVGHGRTIWYDDKIIETKEITIPAESRQYTYDIQYALKKLGYEVEYRNYVFCGADQSTYIEFSPGKDIIVSNESKHNIAIIAKIDTAKAKSFEFFDDLRKFERFFHLTISLVEKINAELDEDTQDSDSE